MKRLRIHNNYDNMFFWEKTNFLNLNVLGAKSVHYTFFKPVFGTNALWAVSVLKRISPTFTQYIRHLRKSTRTRNVYICWQEYGCGTVTNCGVSLTGYQTPSLLHARWTLLPTVPPRRLTHMVHYLRHVFLTTKWAWD